MGIYHLKMHSKVVRYQMSHCYLCFKFKTNLKKLYVECFMAVYFPTLNKKDPVYTITNLLKWNHYISYMGRIVFIGKLVQKFQVCLWSTFELREILVVHCSSNLYEWLVLDRFNRQSFLELLMI